MLQYCRDFHTGSILIRGARQLLTLRGERAPRRGAELNELSIIHDGAVLVRDGVLEEIGPTRRVENLAAARRTVEVNAAGRVVIPGFVDCHTHLPFPLPGMPEHDPETAARLVRANSGKRLAAKLLAYLEAMARHGTTTVEAQAGCQDESAAIKLLRVLGLLKREPIDVVPSFLCRLPAVRLDGQTAMEAALEWAVGTLLPKLQKRRLTHFADLVCDGEAAHQPYYSRFLEEARRMGFRCRIQAEPGPGGAPSRQAIALAEEGPVLSIGHLENVAPHDLERLAACGTMATLLPCCGLRNGAEREPARALIAAGVPVALATNFNPLHTPTLNMQTAVALATMNLGMTVAEAISAATINAAHVAGCAERAGSLELGKPADLAILNIGDYRNLAHHFGTNLVHLTMKRGNFIYQEGRVAPLAAEDLEAVW